MPWESNSLREEKAAAWVITDATEVIHSFKWIGGSAYYVPGAALSTGDTANTKTKILLSYEAGHTIKSHTIY